MKTDLGVRSWFWVIAVVVLALECSSSSPKATGTPRCTLASQCAGTDVCALGYCVPACAGSKDCPTGERCVQPDVTIANSFVCQAPEVSKCQYNSQCMTLFCSSDGQCRNECMMVGAQSVDCPLGLNGLHMDCAADPVNAVNFCADPVADVATYNPGTLMIIPQANTGGTTGGAGSGGAGGAGGTSATGKGGAGGKGSSAAGGRTVSGCTTPQTAFGNVAQGDANANFVNGVAARVQDRLLIFSAYAGPPVALGAGGGDAGAGGAGGAGATANYVFVQAFDPITGASMGTATPLFRAADGTNFGLWTAAVSSAGEVALVWGTGPPNANHTSLSVSFLSSAPATVAPGVQFEKSVVVESSELGDVAGFWSEANQEYVFSWKYNTNGWQIRTKKFQNGGTPAGGDTNAVGTVNGINGADYSVGAGASGRLFGVAYRDAGNGNPTLSLLDSDGNAVGVPTFVSAANIGAWVNVGGTAKGFVVLYQTGSTASGVFIPKLSDDSGIVIPSGAGGAGGASGAGGSSGAAWTTFSVPSTTTTANRAYSIGDELGAGGVGTVYSEVNGASFLYVTSDGAKRYAVGTVLSSSQGATVSITNFGGSFSVSLYETTKHATQAAASACTP